MAKDRAGDGREFVGAAIGALAVVAVSGLLVPFRGHIAEVNVALVLVVFVLLGAVIGGRWAGLVAAVVAGMSFDFMHTRPYNSLKIANAADVETTVLLILVGVIVGEIALRGDRIRAAVGDHRRSISRVHRVAQLAAAGDSVDDVISAVRAELIETLHLQECLFECPPFTKKLPTIEPSGAIDTNVYRYTRGGFELPRDGVEIPVVSRDRTVGRFVLVPSPGVGVSLEERMIAVALADQLGVVLGRAAA